MKNSQSNQVLPAFVQQSASSIKFVVLHSEIDTIEIERLNLRIHWMHCLNADPAHKEWKQWLMCRNYWILLIMIPPCNFRGLSKSKRGVSKMAHWNDLFDLNSTNSIWMISIAQQSVERLCKKTAIMIGWYRAAKSDTNLQIQSIMKWK